MMDDSFVMVDDQNNAGSQPVSKGANAFIASSTKISGLNDDDCDSVNFAESNKNLAEALNKKPLDLIDDDLPPSTAIEEVKK